MIQARLTFLEQAGRGPAALQITTPADTARTPIHFVALIDVSESMSDDNKLTHVKHCLSLLLKFLAPTDQISIVTFGDDAKIVVQAVETASTSLPTLEAAIAGLQTDGCTNLSAGLAAVRLLLDGDFSTTSLANPKTMVLLLTDGHANRGVTAPAQLHAMLARIEEKAPGTSFSFLAYGTDHNAELLRSMAAQNSAPYSIINDLESAALTIGESLGGAFSCCAQAVSLRCPPGTRPIGTHRLDADGTLRIGDLYSGSEQCILLDVPPSVAGAADAATEWQWTFQGVQLPDLTPFQQHLLPELNTSPPIEIRLARMQADMASLFRRIRVNFEPVEAGSLRASIEILRTELEKEIYRDHPIAKLLRAELPSLVTALDVLTSANRTRHYREYLHAQLATHEHYVLLGRGTAQPIEAEAAPAPAEYEPDPDLATLAAAVGWSEEEDIENPSHISVPMTRSVTSNPGRVRSGHGRTARTSYLSPTTSMAAQRVAVAMQELSQALPADQPEEE